MDFLIVGRLEELSDLLGASLKKKERVLLCFPGSGDDMGSFFATAVESSGGVGIFWGNDFLWKTLLHSAFSERCSTVIGSPEIILGLGKLAKRQGVPLYIRKAVLIGHLPDEWMVEAIQATLDCKILACCCKSSDGMEDASIEKLSRELRRWTTILDFRLEKMGAGLSLEMITFPGEKLPKLPSFAKLVVREWNPGMDCPFCIPIRWKNACNS